MSRWTLVFVDKQSECITLSDLLLKRAVAELLAESWPKCEEFHVLALRLDTAEILEATQRCAGSQDRELTAWAIDPDSYSVWKVCKIATKYATTWADEWKKDQDPDIRRLTLVFSP